jgi:hypothetical protein
MDPETAKVTRTSSITTVEQLGAGIREVRELAERAGRDPDALDFPVQALHANLEELGTPEVDDRWCREVEQLRAAGVTWLFLEPPASSPERCVEVLDRVASQLLPKVR